MIKDYKFVVGYWKSYSMIVFLTLCFIWYFEKWQEIWCFFYFDIKSQFSLFIFLDYWNLFRIFNEYYVLLLTNLIIYIDNILWWSHKNNNLCISPTVLKNISKLNFIGFQKQIFLLQELFWMYFLEIINFLIKFISGFTFYHFAFLMNSWGILLNVGIFDRAIRI